MILPILQILIFKNTLFYYFPMIVNNCHLVKILLINGLYKKKIIHRLEVSVDK